MDCKVYVNPKSFFFQYVWHHASLYTLMNLLQCFFHGASSGNTTPCFRLKTLGRYHAIYVSIGILPETLLQLVIGMCIRYVHASHRPDRKPKALSTLDVSYSFLDTFPSGNSILAEKKKTLVNALNVFRRANRLG